MLALLCFSAPSALPLWLPCGKAGRVGLLFTVDPISPKGFSVSPSLRGRFWFRCGSAALQKSAAEPALRRSTIRTQEQV
jgi:hypothetical protein